MLRLTKELETGNLGTKIMGDENNHQTEAEKFRNIISQIFIVISKKIKQDKSKEQKPLSIQKSHTNLMSNRAHTDFFLHNFNKELKFHKVNTFL